MIICRNLERTIWCIGVASITNKIKCRGFDSQRHVFILRLYLKLGTEWEKVKHALFHHKIHHSHKQRTRRGGQNPWRKTGQVNRIPKSFSFVCETRATLPPVQE